MPITCGLTACLNLVSSPLSQAVTRILKGHRATIQETTTLNYLYRSFMVTRYSSKSILRFDSVKLIYYDGSYRDVKRRDIRINFGNLFSCSSLIYHCLNLMASWLSWWYSLSQRRGFEGPDEERQPAIITPGEDMWRITPGGLGGGASRHTTRHPRNRYVHPSHTPTTSLTSPDNPYGDIPSLSPWCLYEMMKSRLALVE